ncbi:unnamed protein product, partial [Schistosoma spindalis]
FVNLATDEEIHPKFPFKFYGTDVSELTIHTNGNSGLIDVKGKKDLGTIYTQVVGGGLSGFEISNESEFFIHSVIFCLVLYFSLSFFE